MLPKSKPEEDFFLSCHERERINDDMERFGWVLNKDESMGIEVLVSDRLALQNHHRLLYFNPVYDNYLCGSGIVMTSEFRRQIEENPYLFSLVWHEVGHFHTVPYMLDDVTNVNDQRIDCLINGEVMPIELVADLFAAWATSKEDVIAALRWSRASRKKQMRPGDIATVMAIDEYTKRIRFLRGVESGKELETFYKIFEEDKVR
jgi:hypothetical protein